MLIPAYPADPHLQSVYRKYEQLDSATGENRVALLEELGFAVDELTEQRGNDDVQVQFLNAAMQEAGA
jgi:hypothetical protein